MRRVWAALAATTLLSGCFAAFQEDEKPTEPERLVTRWDHRPEAETWNAAMIEALQQHGAPLISLVPTDIDDYCPSYPEASEDDRRAFWVGLFSALAFHESTWNPKAVGGGGLWYGLVQIDPRSARWFGCEATTGAALKDGVANLRCGVRIAAKQVPRRGTVSRGMRDWGPFHNASKRAEMASFTRTQAYCTPRPEPEKSFFAKLFGGAA